MIAGTHIAFASTLYLGGAALFEYETDMIGWALASAASLLPDADLPTSKIGRALFWLSTHLEKHFGHRTLTHSFLAIAALALLCSPLLLIKPIYFWCVLGGYWSHLWIDMLNIRMARDSFIKKAGTRWYTLELEAIDNLTLEHITCRCPVLGVWQSGLIVLHDGKPRAVGESQVHHNLHPTSAKLIEGEPLKVVSYKVDMRGKHLAWLLDRIDRQRTYYLMGKMMVGKELKAVDSINLYRPADFDGKVLHLHYAQAQELEPYLNMVAAQGEVYVQFWLRPGEGPVELSVGEDKLESVIPGVLRPYL